MRSENVPLYGLPSNRPRLTEANAALPLHSKAQGYYSYLYLKPTCQRLARPLALIGCLMP